MTTYYLLPTTYYSLLTGGDPSLYALPLYSLMALVNLSYCNADVQRLIRVCGGVLLLQSHLLSPMYEVRF